MTIDRDRYETLCELVQGNNTDAEIPQFLLLSGRQLMSTESEIEIHLFTDGGCSGNPGPGGWAFLLRHLPSGKEIETSGSKELTTNNQMELEAVVQGLSALKRSCRVELFTDSTYVGKGMTEWMPKWKSNDWKRKDNGKLVPVKNQELWMRLDEQLQRHEIKYTWVKGHSEHPENDRVDELAVEAYQKYL